MKTYAVSSVFVGPIHNHTPEDWAERIKKAKATRIRNAIAHARWAATQYAKDVVNLAEANLIDTDPLEWIGGNVVLLSAMDTYEVYPALRKYAATICTRLIREKGVR
jgi:hypothetical protein